MKVFLSPQFSLRPQFRLVLSEKTGVPARRPVRWPSAFTGSYNPHPNRVAIPAGTRLGSYEVAALIGTGGMGEVYRATDTRLNRPVAIKFLADELADAVARRRFQREAQMASALNHPHILTVYDVGEFEGRQYLVTEFVDGGTLRDWAQAEKRSWHQIVELLTGVADALAAAHAAGILHRDIKPANILVAKNGYAKLADFGLAKLDESAASTPRATRPTAGHAAGVIVGTVAYMSPEQASGHPRCAQRHLLVRRGAVRSSWRGAGRLAETRTSKSSRTSFTGLRNRSTEPFRCRCGSSSRRRWRRIRRSLPVDARMVVDLRRAGRQSHNDAAGGSDLHRARLPWMVAGVLAVGVGVWLLTRGPSAGNPLAGATFTRFTDFEGIETNPAISPDGKFVAFISDREGTFEVWLGQIDSGRMQNLTQGKVGDVRAPLRSLGFTGDGTEIWIAGIDGRRLRLLPLVGGTPRNFLRGAHRRSRLVAGRDAPRVSLQGAGDPCSLRTQRRQPATLLAAGPPDEHRHFQVWSQDGRWIYFARGRPATREMDLWRISSAGGAPEQLTNVNTDVAFPTPIDARTILYVAHEATGPDRGCGRWIWKARRRGE